MSSALASPPAPPLRTSMAALLAGLLVAVAVVAVPRGVVRWLPPAAWSDPLLARPAWAAGAALLAGLALVSTARRLAARPALHLLLGLLVLALQSINLRLASLNLFNIVVPALATLWFVDRVVAPERRLPVPALAHVVVVLAALALATLAFRPEPAVSLRALLMWLPKLAMAWLLLRLLQDVALLDRLLRLLAQVSVAAALLGVLQAVAFVLWGQELHLMEEYAPRYITVMGWPMLRASGLMPNPQAYAYPLLLAAVWLWCGLLQPGGRGRPRWRDTLALLLIVSAYGLSFARGAWLALGVVALLAPLLVRPRLAGWWLALLGMAAITLLASGAARSLIASFGSFTASSADVRVELLDAGLRVLAEHPWRGVGINRFDALSPTLERYPVHNATLQLAVEMGLPALLVYATVLLAPWVGGLAALRPRGDAQARHRVLALLLAHAALLAAIQGDPMAYSECVLFSAVLLESARRAWRLTLPVHSPDADGVPLVR